MQRRNVKLDMEAPSESTSKPVTRSASRVPAYQEPDKMHSKQKKHKSSQGNKDPLPTSSQSQHHHLKLDEDGDVIMGG